MDNENKFTLEPADEPYVIEVYDKMGYFLRSPVYGSGVSDQAGELIMQVNDIVAAARTIGEAHIENRFKNLVDAFAFLASTPNQEFHPLAAESTLEDEVTISNPEGTNQLQLCNDESVILNFKKNGSMHVGKGEVFLNDSGIKMYSTSALPIIQADEEGGIAELRGCNMSSVVTPVSNTKGTIKIKDIGEVISGNAKKIHYSSILSTSNEPAIYNASSKGIYLSGNISIRSTYGTDIVNTKPNAIHGYVVYANGDTIPYAGDPDGGKVQIKCDWNVKSGDVLVEGTLPDLYEFEGVPTNLSIETEKNGKTVSVGGKDVPLYNIVARGNSYKTSVTVKLNGVGQENQQVELYLGENLAYTLDSQAGGVYTKTVGADTYDVYVNGKNTNQTIVVDAEGKSQEVLFYKLTYHVNGENVTGTLPSDDTWYLSGSPVILPIPVNSQRQGYVWQGWATSENGTGISTFNIGSGKTDLYAVWKKISSPEVCVTDSDATDKQAGKYIAFKEELFYVKVNGAVVTVPSDGKILLPSEEKECVYNIEAADLNGNVAVISITVPMKSNKVTTPTPTPAPTAAPTQTSTPVSEVIAKEKDVTGSDFLTVLLQVKKTEKKAITYKWKKVKEADGYWIYYNKCGKKNAVKKVEDINKTSWTKKNLKKGTMYKIIVAAYKNVNGTPQIISVSKMIHSITTGNKKYSNPTGVKLNKSKITLKKNKVSKIKAKEVLKKGKKMKKHRAINFQSSNEKVATVTEKGVVKAVSKGKCTIYAYTQNGVYKKCTVIVK